MAKAPARTLSPSRFTDTDSFFAATATVAAAPTPKGTALATLAQITTFALGNPDLQQRFKASRIQAAWDILAEASPSANRVAWRNKIFNNPDADLTREYVWALSHTNIQSAGAAITDANLNIATKSFVDAWAAIA